MSATGLLVLVVVLGVATAVGLVLRSRSGRVRAASPVPPAGNRPAVIHVASVPGSWDGRCHERPVSATLASVNWPLTRRRAVDLCRLAGCLCRAS